MLRAAGTDFASGFVCHVQGASEALFLRTTGVGSRGPSPGPGAMARPALLAAGLLLLCAVPLWLRGRGLPGSASLEEAAAVRSLLALGPAPEGLEEREGARGEPLGYFLRPFAAPERVPPAPGARACGSTWQKACGRLLQGLALFCG